MDKLLIFTQLWVCGDGTVTKFGGDVQSYKANIFLCKSLAELNIFFLITESHRQQHQSKTLGAGKSQRHAQILYVPFYIHILHQFAWWIPKLQI